MTEENQIWCLYLRGKTEGKKAILVVQTDQSSTDRTQILRKEWKTKEIK